MRTMFGLSAAVAAGGEIVDRRTVRTVRAGTWVPSAGRGGCQFFFGAGKEVRYLATRHCPQTKFYEPIVWTVNCGKGRVVRTPMGYDVFAMSCVGFMTTVQRSAEWAATGKVTLLLPDNFPTAEKASQIKELYLARTAKAFSVQSTERRQGGEIAGEPIVMLLPVASPQRLPSSPGAPDVEPDKPFPSPVVLQDAITRRRYHAELGDRSAVRQNGDWPAGGLTNARVGSIPRCW